MYIKVKVHAGLRKESFEKTGIDECLICVKEKAEGNAANERVIDILKHEYAATRVRLVSGHHSPSKIVDIS